MGGIRKQASGKPIAGQSGGAGKITVVFSYDSCAYCKRERYGKMAAMAKTLTLAATQNKVKSDVVFRGYFFKETMPYATALTEASKLYAETKPEFPVAVSHYKNPVTPEELNRNVLFHEQGVAVLDREGKVAYLQIEGTPKAEFWAAFSASAALQQRRSSRPSRAP